MPIRLFYEGTRHRVRDLAKITSWIRKAIKAEGHKLGDINYVLCTDAFLLPLNRHFLHHATLTDIITFQFHSTGEPLAGEIYISIDRVKENAKSFGVRSGAELRRVMIHGILHLMGYRDKTRADRAQMRNKEDAYLSLWK